MFGRVLQHFDGHFDRIRAVWGPDLPDNLNLYNVGEILDYAPDVAARLTHTGQWAEEAGYRRVSVRPQGPVGNRTYVEADFRACR